MLYFKKISNAVVKTLLFAMVSLVFVTTTVAFGNTVFGVLFGALYIYEVARGAYRPSEPPHPQLWY